MPDACLLLLLPLCVGILCWAFLCYGPWCPFLFCNHLVGEERAGYFVLAVLLMSCGCLRSLSLPRGSAGWSVVCE